MGATLLRWLKWALLGWGVLSLLGVGTLATIAWVQYGKYQAAIAQAQVPPKAEDDARRAVELRWGEGTRTEFIGRHVTAADATSRRRLRVTAVHVGAAPESTKNTVATFGDHPTSWARGDLASPLAAMAMAHVESRLALPGPSWLPSLVELRGAAMRVNVSYLYANDGSIDSLTIHAWRPSDNTLFIIEESWSEGGQ